MSVVLESSFTEVTMGTPCVNQDGKLFTVLGMYDAGYNYKANDKADLDHELYLHFNSSLEACGGPLSLVGLYYDPERPERQGIVKERVMYAEPVLDLDQDLAESAARVSIFMDPQALEVFIRVIKQDVSALEDGSPAKSKLLTF